MPSWLSQRYSGPAAGALALAITVVAALLMPIGWQTVLNEGAFDLVLAADRHLRSSPVSPVPIVVVDIDRRSLDAIGPWPWSRDKIANLVDRVAGAKPAVIGIDILFALADVRSPAALARQLGALTANPDITKLAEGLADGDKRLEEAIDGKPVVLGYVLDSDLRGSVPGVPVLGRRPLSLEQFWYASGAIIPLSPLASVAAGLGALSLPGDADGKVRKVPMFVGVGDGLRPGLALEMVRVFRQSRTYLVEFGPSRVVIGDHEIALPRDGFLRLAPTTPSGHDARAISAIDLIADPSSVAMARGGVVLIGSSAPELGGLRETSGDPLTPSMQIQADAVEQLLAGRVPRTVPPVWSILLAVAYGLLAIWSASSFSPLRSAAIVSAAIASVWIGSISLSVTADRLFDPLTPSLCALLTFIVTSIGLYASQRRREARLRSRFEQHLAPAVVRRIVEEPDLLKLRGEKREVTALFTDIEGFTAMTHRAGPEQLVAALDAYIEGVSNIIMSNGGMIDKIVGDSVHALFNAPVDLEDHSRCAVESAIAIRSWTKAYQLRPTLAAIGFGRTRIGVETGIAIVGDIGIQSKLDYTAHGDVINSAARLEAINKELGSTICVGPVAASQCETTLFRPLGVVALRGLDDPIEVFEPWPPEFDPIQRARYLAASQASNADRERAAEQFEALATECPHDGVMANRAKRLRSA